MGMGSRRRCRFRRSKSNLETAEAVERQRPQNVTFIQGQTIAEISSFRLGQAVDLSGDYYAPKNLEKSPLRMKLIIYISPYADVNKEVPPLKYTAEEIEKFSTVKQRACQLYPPERR